VQLTYNNNKKLAVTASVGYGYINNMDLRITTIDPLTNITYSTYQNTGKASRVGLDYNLSYPITNEWNISANGNVQYFRVSGLVGSTIIRIKKADAYISASSGYKLEKGWRLNANVMFRTRAITDLQSTGNAVATSSFSVNKELIKNKLSFAASVNNPFAKYRYIINNTFGPDFVQVSNTQEYFRSVSLSLNYNFGKLKSDIRKGQRGINNDDVSK
jgi:ferric enterobactin receptor